MRIFSRGRIPQPATQAEFFRTFVQAIAIQTTVMAGFASLYFYADAHDQSSVSILVLGALSLIMAYISLFVEWRLDLRRRLLDLYPNAQLPGYWSACVVRYLPFLAIPIYGFLLFKKKSCPEESVPFAFRHLGKLSMIGLVVSIVGPSLAFATLTFLPTLLNKPSLWLVPSAYCYWLSSPATRYIILLSHEVEDALNEKKRLGDLTLSADLIQLSQDVRVGSSTSAILLEVVVVTQAMKIKTRAPASSDQSLAFLALFEGSTEVLEKWDHRTPAFARQNPINYVSPTAVLEGALISIVDHVLESKARARMINVILEKINQWEAYYPDRKFEADQFRNRIRATKAFKDNLSSLWQ